MISRATLITQGFADMADYYDGIAVNYLNGKLTMARTSFKALSKQQRKEFIARLASEWKAQPAEPIHEFFFNLL